MATTVLGLVPLLWATGTGSDVMKPIAVPLSGGMVTSTVHVLLVTPSFFSLNRRTLHLSGLRERGSENRMKGIDMRKLVMIALLGACAQQEQPGARQEAAPAPPAEQAGSPAAIQEHTIDVTGDFTPASVTLKAGQPARLHFRRTDAPTCADEVLISDLGIRRKLEPNQTVTIDIPAQNARTLRFACGMNMMKGSIVVQ